MTARLGATGRMACFESPGRDRQERSVTEPSQLSQRAPPYTPGFGVSPPLLAGRDEVLTDIMASLAAGPQHPFFVSALLGRHGVGKTSLLDEVAGQVRERLGWAVVHRELVRGVDLAADIADALTPALQAWRRFGRAYRQLEKELCAEAKRAANLGQSPARPQLSRHQSGAVLLGELLSRTGWFALEHRSGMLIVVDEATSARPGELVRLATLVKMKLAASGLPVALILAGPRSLSRTIGAAERTLARGWVAVRSLGDLAPCSVERALAEPAARLGVRWEPAALDLVVDRSAGHPHYVQLYGYHTWKAAKGATRLGLAHAETGIKTGDAVLSGQFERTWAGLWPQEKFFLSRLASGWGFAPANILDIYATMRPNQVRLNVVRNRLIYLHGLLTMPRRGELHFVSKQFVEWLVDAHPGTSPGRQAAVRQKKGASAGAPPGRERRLRTAPEVDNPFRPSSGEQPPVMAGRGVVMNDFEAAFEEVSSGNYGGTKFLVGASGLGKTALLARLGGEAQRRGWLHLHLVAGPERPVIGPVVEQTRCAAHVVSVLAGRTAEEGIEDWFVRLAKRAKERQPGALLTVDDLDSALRVRRLGWLAGTTRRSASENWPVLTVIAGLPSLCDMTNVRAYPQHTAWHTLDLLDGTEAARALQEPAAMAGRPMDDETADLLVQASAGFPYALQLHGYEAWQASKGKDRIGVDVARRSIVTARQGLDERLYGPTWRRCLPGEREYLAVVAWLLEQGDRVSGQKVAHKLGTTVRGISAQRAHLQ